MGSVGGGATVGAGPGFRFAGHLGRVGGWDLAASGASGRGRGAIFLAGGHPDTSVFGGGTLRGLAGALVEDGPAALQYGLPEGTGAMRDVAAGLMEAEGTPAGPEHVLVTNGAQQGLDLAGRALLEDGDLAIVASPTYHGALRAFAPYGARILTAPVDRRGLNVEAVREILVHERRNGSRAKFVYTIPTFQNPTGTTMPAGRRRELLELAREHDLLIIEDNPYGLLRYDGFPSGDPEGAPPETLAAMEIRERGGPERVVYLGSLSKVFAPGVRLGWAHAHPDVLAAMLAAKSGADLGPSALSQTLAAAYFAGGEWQGYLRELKRRYRSRRDAMLGALGELMPEGVSWTEPGGGFFVWVTLPDGLDAAAMLPEAVARGVAYVPGADFHPGGWGQAHGANALRLSFSLEGPRRIHEGVGILAEIVAEELERLAAGGPACGCGKETCRCAAGFSCTEDLVGAVAC